VQTIDSDRNSGAYQFLTANSLPGIIGGEHTFALSPTRSGTRLVQSETFRGLLALFSGQTIANTSTSFRELNEALKKRAEAG
jgi:hypothetical protein